MVTVLVSICHTARLVSGSQFYSMLSHSGHLDLNAVKRNYMDLKAKYDMSGKSARELLHHSQSAQLKPERELLQVNAS